jgi:D-alanine-D-alanine ligase
MTSSGAASGWAVRLPPTPVAVLLGGPSAEHDVSIVSGLAIARALRGRGHPTSAWYIDLEGGWWALPSELLAGSAGPPDARAFDDPAAMGGAGPRTAAATLETLAGRSPAPVVFPALHGPFGEDGTVQALVASVGLTCCGSGVAASAVGMDKPLFKRLCRGQGMPVLPWVDIDGPDWRDRRSEVLGRLEAFAAGLDDRRLVVKPARLGSSIGIGIVHRPDEPPELEHAVDDALRYGDQALAEPYLDHPRELEVALVGDGRADLDVFGPGEVLPGREFYDYEAKYRSDASRTLLQPDLDPGLATAIREIAADSFLAIGASGFARVDFLVSRDGKAWLSEINTIPGFTPISLFPSLVAAGGHDFGAVCERIVGLAAQRASLGSAPRLARTDLP